MTCGESYSYLSRKLQLEVPSLHCCFEHGDSLMVFLSGHQNDGTKNILSNVIEQPNLTGQTAKVEQRNQ